MQRVLVVGVPRSGTTWVGTVLARSARATYLGEPDNHLRFAFALRAKLRAGQRQYPALAPDDDGRGADLRVLWENAFSDEPRQGIAELRGRGANRLVEVAGGMRIMRLLEGTRSSQVLRAAVALAVPERPRASAASLVVKSVYAPLYAEWVQARHEDVGVVAVVRHPRNVVSSWVELGWMDPSGPDPILAAFDPVVAEDLAALYEAPIPQASRLSRSTWLVAALTCALEDACRRNPHWLRVVHEELCLQPVAGFRAVAAAAGLAWSEVGDDRLAETNRPGEGYEPTRVSSEMPDAWRRRLSDEQVREVDAVLAHFPLGGPR